MELTRTFYLIAFMINTILRSNAHKMDVSNTHFESRGKLSLPSHTACNGSHPSPAASPTSCNHGHTPCSASDDTHMHLLFPLFSASVLLPLFPASGPSALHLFNRRQFHSAQMTLKKSVISLPNINSETNEQLMSDVKKRICVTSQLAIKDSYYSKEPIFSVCSSSKKTVTGISFGPKINFIFNSSVVRGARRTGFRLKVNLVQECDCGEVVKGERKGCTNSLTQYNIQGASPCTYAFQSPSERFRMHVDFNDWNFPLSATCDATTHMEISTTGKAEDFQSYCGPEQPYINWAKNLLLRYVPTKNYEGYHVGLSTRTVAVRGRPGQDSSFKDRCVCGVYNTSEIKASRTKLGEMKKENLPPEKKGRSKSDKCKCLRQKKKGSLKGIGNRRRKKEKQSKVVTQKTVKVTRDKCRRICQKKRKSEEKVKHNTKLNQRIYKKQKLTRMKVKDARWRKRKVTKRTQTKGAESNEHKCKCFRQKTKKKGTRIRNQNKNEQNKGGTRKKPSKIRNKNVGKPTTRNSNRCKRICQKKRKSKNKIERKIKLKQRSRKKQKLTRKKVKDVRGRQRKITKPKEKKRGKSKGENCKCLRQEREQKGPKETERGRKQDKNKQNKVVLRKLLRIQNKKRGKSTRNSDKCKRICQKKKKIEQHTVREQKLTRKKVKDVRWRQKKAVKRKRKKGAENRGDECKCFMQQRKKKVLKGTEKIGKQNKNKQSKGITRKKTSKNQNKNSKKMTLNNKKCNRICARWKQGKVTKKSAGAIKGKNNTKTWKENNKKSSGSNKIKDIKQKSEENFSNKFNWPWQTLIIIGRKKRNSSCQGILISTKHVLTTGACVNKGYVSARDVKVSLRLGKKKVNRSVKAITAEITCNNKSPKFCMVILHLSRNTKRSKSGIPICLPCTLNPMQGEGYLAMWDGGYEGSSNKIYSFKTRSKMVNAKFKVSEIKYNCQDVKFEEVGAAFFMLHNEPGFNKHYMLGGLVAISSCKRRNGKNRGTAILESINDRISWINSITKGTCTAPIKDIMTS